MVKERPQSNWVNLVGHSSNTLLELSFLLLERVTLVLLTEIVSTCTLFARFSVSPRLQLNPLASYSFGGTDGQYHYNDTWSYDLNSGIWTELSCIGYIPVPREGHAATLVDDVMYVFGGRGVDGKDLEDLAAFKIGSAFESTFDR